MQESIPPFFCVGAKVPRNANAVVMLEHTSTPEPKKIRILNQIERSKNISLKGEDIKKNQILLRKGTWLAPQDIGVVASVGISKIPVRTKPKVAIFATGNELVEPGRQLYNNSKIFESNGIMVSSMVNNFGGNAINLGICADNREAISNKLKESLSYDLAVVSGGSSVGDLDFVPALIKEMGNPGLLVHGVAMKPGSPCCFRNCKRRTNCCSTRFLLFLPSTPLGNRYYRKFLELLGLQKVE